MYCRHTVPDWHRYTEANPASPIFAGCRLLIQAGERSSDPRAIACTFWGRQTECPLYDGPGKRAPANRLPASPAQDEPLPAEAVWPVRPPGARDWGRNSLIAVVLLSIGLLLWAGLSVRSGWSGATRIVLGIAVGVSVTAHLLTLLRLWARR